MNEQAYANLLQALQALREYQATENQGPAKRAALLHLTGTLGPT